VTLLMPVGSFRWCPLSTCGHRWYVAYPKACSCPKCGSDVADASDGWPHGCTNGHSAHHGGPCAECVVEVGKKKEARASRG
jgi:hypothetical protein